MWMIRWFFVALVIFLISAFIYNNKDLAPISVDFVFSETGRMSPVLAMFFSYLAGFITWFVISLFNFFKMRNEIAAKDKIIRNLKGELNNYRNASLSMQDGNEKTVIMHPEEETSEPDEEK